jgi:hypothetical protein
LKEKRIMTEGKKPSRKVSRRDFLVAGGAIIAAGALSSCAAKTTTITTTLPATTVTTTKTVTQTATGPGVTQTVTGPGVTQTVTGSATTKTVTSTSAVTTTATTTANPATTKIVVFDPRGTPSPITLVPMAKRLDTLDGKTIYVVDIMYPYTQVFVSEVAKILQEKYPKTTWVYRQKYGTYMNDDPDTWNLIQAKAQGMVIAVGH